MATSRGWKINQSPVYPSLDHNYRKRLRRSIEYLRQKNRLGYDDGSSTESRWEWCGGSPTDDETQEHRLRQIKGCHSSPKTLPTDGVYHRHQKAVCPGRIERLVRGQLDTHGKHLRSRGRGRKRGRLLLIIDVQSRQGAIEEVYVREGDNVFLLAEAFTIRHDLGAQHALAVGLHIQKKVLETGSIVAADGRCWSSHATAYSAETSGEAPPGPEGLRYDGNFHPQEQQKLSRGGVQSWAGVCGRGPKRTAMDSEQEGCTLHGMAGWDQEEYNSPHEFSILETRDHDVKSGTLDWRRKSRNGIRPSLGGERLAKWTGNTQECKMGSQAGFNRGWDSWLDFRRATDTATLKGAKERNVFATTEGRSLAQESDKWNDRSASRAVIGEPTVRIDGCESDDEDEDAPASFHDDLPERGVNEKERLFRRARASWSGCLAGAAGGGGVDENDWTVVGIDRKQRGYLQNQRNGATPFQLRGGIPPSTARRSNLRTLNRRRCHWTNNGASTRGGRIPWEELSVHDGPEARGWESAPDDGGKEVRPPLDGGQSSSWRHGGALGRNSMSRVALRQLHASERLYRQGRVLARKREITRRRQNDLEAAASSGRLNLCVKTRELTDNAPRYRYTTGRRYEDCEGKEEEEYHTCFGRDGRYRDAGDRLYSEWKVMRRKEKTRHETEKDLDAEGGSCPPEDWTCPKCGSYNRARDRTCQTVTGIMLPAQDLRPGTWCHESPEKLGRAAAIASAAVTARPSEIGNLTPHARRKSAAGSGRETVDGLRRCGTPQPRLFKPTPIAKRCDDALYPRHRGKLLYEELYRNSPTPFRRRAQKILGPEMKLTFTPKINEKSRRLAKVHEARRYQVFNMFYSGTGSGGSSSSSSNNVNIGEMGGGGESSSGAISVARSERQRQVVTRDKGDRILRRSKRFRCAPSKVVAKSFQLYSERKEIEQRKQQLRKDIVSQSCPFAPDIGMSAAWPSQDKNAEEFVRRLHDEHRKQQHRREAKRRMLYGDDESSAPVNPTTGRPLFMPTINNKHRRPSRSKSADVFRSGGSDGNGVDSRHLEVRENPTRDRVALALSEGEERENGQRCRKRRQEVFSRLWEQSLAVRRRRAADAREREEARRVRASEGHVTGRSAHLVRAMRMRGLLQIYRTLLASVEYAHLPDGLGYDEAMESTIRKIHAIFDNDNDAWQEMTLEVAKADPSVLKPELVDIVASALAGHGRETLGLREFCEILDASLRNATTRGPTAHFFSTPDRGTSSAAGEGTAAAASAAAERALQEEEAELKEMTFRPKIGKKSTTIARLMGRDGSKPIEEILQKEASTTEVRQRAMHQDQERRFQEECPFKPKFFSSNPFKPRRPRYPNYRAAAAAAAHY